MSQRTTPHIAHRTPHATRNAGAGSLAWWVILALLVLWVFDARATQLQDLARVKGSETSKLVGMGLVVGLDGTGDSAGFASSHKMLAEMVRRYGDETAALSAISSSDAVALVYLSAEIPGVGVRSGDKLDVQVAKAGDAESLAGGRLLLCYLTGPAKDAPVMAAAEGAITLDPNNPVAGKVIRGGQMLRDVVSQSVDPFGRIHLVLNDDVASWPASTALARLINEVLAPDGPTIARAADQRNILVTLPRDQRDDPGGFIAQILRTFVEPTLIHSGAKVVINERTGTIVLTGDVRVSPVVISHDGLTITAIRPAPPNPDPANAQPQLVTEDFLTVDPQNRGGEELAALLQAFNQLKVPAQDRIEIIRQIARAGKLHARLIEQD
ncbi:MAG: flagellar basal body P-ring protein FlgI [Planctomycetota bacterium]